MRFAVGARLHARIATELSRSAPQSLRLPF
jgi:hypothetical protein